jgi:replicative DNA helicase
VSNFEESVIGSVLLTNGKALDDLTLTPETSYDLNNGKIYEAMLEIKRDRLPIDVVTVCKIAKACQLPA